MGQSNTKNKMDVSHALTVLQKQLLWHDLNKGFLHNDYLQKKNCSPLFFFEKIGFVMNPSIDIISVSSETGTSFSFILAPKIATILFLKLLAFKRYTSLSL